MSSTKNTQPYFPHYANSRNDDNMIRLRLAHGVAGYGVYHMLLERLRMSEGYKCELDYDVLCWDLGCEQEIIRSVIYDFGLFEIVDDGQKFCSIELNAYMQLMEEKKRERQERSRAAAQARWGINVPETPVTTEVSQPALPIVSEETEGKETDRLDKEIQTIKEDDAWLEIMAKESGKSKDEILSFLTDFKDMCILRGLKGGHKDMTDTFSHFRSWIYKSGRAKDPNAKQSVRESTKLRIKATEAQKRTDRDQKIAERNARYALNEKLKYSPEDKIRNWGYDPNEVRLSQVMNPNWREKNPPTHPEWIGLIVTTKEQTVDVPY